MEKAHDCYDLLIVGGGPAGYSAGLYAARAGLKTVVMERLSAGGQMALAHRIDNYPGITPGIDGFSLGQTMKENAEAFGVESCIADVTEAQLSGPIKRLTTDKGSFCGKAVILATGAEPRRLNLPGEAALTGKGISYCASCDGMFFKGKTVAVIGGGETAAGDAEALSLLCKKVYLIHRNNFLRASKVSQNSLAAKDNVTILWNHTVTEIHGQEHLDGITIRQSENGAETKLQCDGLFIAIGRLPASGLAGNQIDVDSQGYIPTDETMCTSLPGVFAAGDVRAKSLRQIVTAAADGAIAANAAEHFLAHSSRNLF